MKHSISDTGGFSTLDVELSQGEELFAQPDSMLCMTSGIEIAARIAGDAERRSILSGVKNMLSGESFFLTIYSAKRDGESLTLAPQHVGEIVSLQLDGATNYYLASGSFLASTSGVTLDTIYSGLKGVMAQKGLFMLHAKGQGTLFLATHGAVRSRDLKEGERFVVDSRFVIAFADSVKYELVTAAKGLKTSMFSGEGLVNRYTGPGNVLYQTRARQRDGFITSMIRVGT